MGQFIVNFRKSSEQGDNAMGQVRTTTRLHGLATKAARHDKDLHVRTQADGSKEEPSGFPTTIKGTFPHR